MSIYIFNVFDHQKLGGTKTFDYLLTKSLKNYGHYVISVNEKKTLGTKLRKPIYDKQIILSNKLFKSKFVANKIFKKIKYSVFILNFPRYLLILPKKSLKNNTIIMQQHFSADYLIQTINKPIYKIVFILRRKYIDKLVVFSQEDKLKLSKFFIRSEIIISPLATEDNDTESKSKREKYVYIGRLDNKQKQIMRLTNIFEKNGIELDVYGSGSQKNDVEEFCKTARYVNYKGILKYNEVKNIFSKYKANIIYSDFEGMPYTIIEAASVSTPTITSNSFSAASDMFSSGNLGLLVYNEDNFIKVLKNFDPSKTNPKKEYIEKYSMPAFEQRWSKIIQQ